MGLCCLGSTQLLLSATGTLCWTSLSSGPWSKCQIHPCVCHHLSLKREIWGTFSGSTATGSDCCRGCSCLAWELHEEGLPLSINSGHKAGWQLWLMIWFQDAKSFLGVTSVTDSYGGHLAFLWSRAQITRAQCSVGISRTCGCRTGLHLRVSGQIPRRCPPRRPGVTVPQGLLLAPWHTLASKCTSQMSCSHL